MANMVFAVVPRAVGLIKVANGQEWEMPVITRFLSKYIKI
jgi:hypothetical protein